jgi:hypothetical protein
MVSRIWHVKHGYLGEKPLFRALVSILKRYLRTRTDDNGALFVDREVRVSKRPGGAVSATLDAQRAKGLFETISSRRLGRRAKNCALPGLQFRKRERNTVLRVSARRTLKKAETWFDGAMRDGLEED